METFLVFTKPIKTASGTVNQELGRELVDGQLAALEGSRDYVVSADGSLHRVVEKIADLKSQELRVLVRPA